MDPLEDLRRKIEAPTAHGHPEVVTTGLPPEVGTAFLNIMGEIVVRERGRFQADGTTDELADGPPMPVIAVEDLSDLTAASSIYGDVQALQIIWTDSRGRLPRETGYANPPGSQRILGAIRPR